MLAVKAPSQAQQLAFAWHSEGPNGLWRRVTGRLRRSGSTGPASASDAWIARHCSVPEPGSHPSLSDAFKRDLGGYSPRTGFLEAFDHAPTDELFDRCVHHDLRSYLPSLLHVEDRTSMALSLESRVPMLDHRLVEFAATVPPDVKVAGHRSKQLIRLAMRGRLPDELIDRRDKGAFPVPVERWMAGPFGDWARRVLSEPRSLERGVHRPEWIRACVRHGRSLFPLLAFELWSRLFLDGDRALRDEARETADRVRRDLRLTTAPEPVMQD
jgi:asparagine synthase (glutamine-hydrolysing)